MEKSLAIAFVQCYCGYILISTKLLPELLAPDYRGTSLVGKLPCGELPE